MVNNRQLSQTIIGAVTGVGFMLTEAVLCLQSQFEDSTLCTAEDSKILLLFAFWLKIKRSHFNSIGKGEAFHGLLYHYNTGGQSFVNTCQKVFLFPALPKQAKSALVLIFKCTLGEVKASFIGQATHAHVNQVINSWVTWEKRVTVYAIFQRSTLFVITQLSFI